MLSKTELRKTVGRGKFTTAAFAQAVEVSTVTARKRIAELTEAGVIEALDEREPVLTADGEPSRGRPRHLFRVAQGK